MSLTKEDLMAISELMDEKLGTMDKRFDGIDRRLDAMDERLDKMDERFDEIDRCLDAMDIRIGNEEEGLRVVQFKQDHTNKKLTNLQLDVEIMERNIRKDIRLLKDGLDTVVEVLQQNELLSC